MRLSYGNERTLRQRLDDLIHMAGEPVEPLVEQCKNFAQTTVRTRNNLAHAGSLGKDGFTKQELPWATAILEEIFIAVLLAGVGFDPERVERCVRRSELWRSISRATNPLTTWRNRECG